ncbi:MAG: hypothetical protein ACM3H9_10555, partial [Rhodospirillaceae bacterium]
MPQAGSGPAIVNAASRPSSPASAQTPAPGGLPLAAAGAGNPNAGLAASVEAIEAAIADIESQFSIYLPNPERVTAACDVLRREAGDAMAAAPPDWLGRLLPLPAKRTGPTVVPLFEWMEETAGLVPDPSPLLSAMLGAQDGALQLRAVRALAQAADAGRVDVGPSMLETLAGMVEREGSELSTEAGLRDIERVLAHAAGAGEWLVQRMSPAVQRLAARVLDLDGAPPSDEVVRRVLGDEAAALLAPYLMFTRATHIDVMALV